MGGSLGSELVDEGFEGVVAGDEIGFAINLDEGANLAAAQDGLSDEAFIGDAVGLFHCGGGSLLAQEIDGGVQVALGRVQGLLAVHQSGTGHGAELPDEGWGDFRHEEYRLWVMCSEKKRRSVIRSGASESVNKFRRPSGRPRREPQGQPVRGRERERSSARRG